MASAHPRGMVLVAAVSFFLLFTSPNPAHALFPAQSTVLSNPPVTALTTLGRLGCTPLGTPSTPNTPPLVGALVNLTCQRLPTGSVNLGSAVSDSNGMVNITANIPRDSFIPISTCRASINLSGVRNCSALSPTVEASTTVIPVGARTTNVGLVVDSLLNVNITLAP